MFIKPKYVYLSFLLPLLYEALLKISIEHLSPDDSVNAVVSLFAGFWLIWLPGAGGLKSEKQQALSPPLILLGCGFLFISTLYFLPWLGVKITVGYDPITELIGSMFFIAAGFALNYHDDSVDDRRADFTLLLLAGILLALAALAKLLFDQLFRVPADSAAARLVIDVCNGLIVLTLLSQFRRSFGRVHLLLRVSIMFWAFAQIVAHGRSCEITPTHACGLTSVQGVVALGIAWSLMLGKIAFVVFVVDGYINCRITSTQEASP